MSSNTLKTWILCLLLTIAACRRAAGTQATARPPLLPPDQSQAVLHILAMTDDLDRMVRANTAGQPFVDMAKQIETDYLACQSTLPEPNAATEVFRQIISGYTVASTLIAGKAPSSKQGTVELVAEAYIRKTMLRRVLTGKATEHDWKSFEAGNKKGN